MRQMRVFLLVLGIGLIGIIGCPGDGAGNVVVGKVTLGDRPVEGTIIFSGKDKKTTAPINPDGSYRIDGLAAGPNQITVQTSKNATAKGNLTFDVKPGKNTHDIKLEP
jgi:hypothetical protein